MARRSVIGIVAAAVIILVLSTEGKALAHCDTMDGPVISKARQAPEKGGVKIVLPWVTADMALESGDSRPLHSLINGKVHEGIH